MDRDLDQLLSRLERVKAIHSLLVHKLFRGSQDIYIDRCDLEEIIDEMVEKGFVKGETAEVILSLHREFHEEVESWPAKDQHRIQVLYLRLNELINNLIGTLLD